MTEDTDELVIRDFKPEDLREVASLLASSFREMIVKIADLPQEKMVDFIIDTGDVFPYAAPGYVVAEKNGEILGLMRLSWLKQKKPKVAYRISSFLRYGWLTTAKLLIMRYLFPEKPRKGDCHVNEIAVLEKARRRGVATRLLRYGQQIALENGLTRYTLNVDSENSPAYNLYKKMGFKIERKQRNLIARWILDEKEWYFMSRHPGPSDN
jgi:ribosomal protein S18 acetylase RimI-like enzyme